MRDKYRIIQNKAQDFELMRVSHLRILIAGLTNLMETRMKLPRQENQLDKEQRMLQLTLMSLFQYGL